MNRQTIMLIVMVVGLGVFFSESIMQLFSKGSAALPSLSKPSAPKGIDDSAIRALLDEAGADSLAFGSDQWSSDIFQDRTKLFESWFKVTGISKGPSGYMAIINEEIIKEGHTMLGFRVTKIQDDHVHMIKNKDKITLELIQ
ncbi:hypothetical protein MGWOODY_Mmi1540 [hydrothermal vent metagenome]|uniref:Uncharacterized protein n=1 Tax=hydrothermal vent metagenome TaxID=652676 RepID=A0A160VIF0_9ZZZZ